MQPAAPWTARTVTGLVGDYKDGNQDNDDNNDNENINSNNNTTK